MKPCTGCNDAAGCRIARDSDRLSRIRDRMEISGNVWLKHRIEEYLNVDVCLATLFGVERRTALDPSGDDYIHHHSLVLQLTLERHRQAVVAEGLA